MADQNEKAFQKQFGIKLNHKNKPGLAKKKTLRRTRGIGLGFKTSREAIDGTYIDKKCPFTGNVRIRGRILSGTLCENTVVLRSDIVTIGESRPLSKTVPFNVLKCSKGQDAKKSLNKL